MKISANYKEISDLINDAQLRGSDIVSHTDQMGTDIANSEIPSVDIERVRLEEQIDSTSNIFSQKNVSYTVRMLQFVGALQKYITEEYGSVDDFLRDNSIKVKSTFADISDEAGYTIDPSLISDVS